MKVDIATLQNDEFKHVGSIRLVSGRAVPESKVKGFMLDYIPDPDLAEGKITPKQGERYLRMLPPQLSQSYINATLVEDG